MEFPCNQCGLCCQTLQNIKKSKLNTRSKKSPFYFPYKLKNGTCEKFDKKIGCTIYDDRPLVCSVNSIAEKLKVDKVEYFNQNLFICNSLMVKSNIENNTNFKLINFIQDEKDSKKS